MTKGGGEGRGAEKRHCPQHASTSHLQANCQHVLAQIRVCRARPIEDKVTKPRRRHGSLLSNAITQACSGLKSKLRCSERHTEQMLCDAGGGKR